MRHIARLCFALLAQAQHSVAAALRANPADPAAIGNEAALRASQALHALAL